jgi:hypothetical protein
MKICPVCKQQYNDVDLNFCLSDGTALMQLEKDSPPPTIFMDAPRNTNPQFDFPQQQTSAPLSEWQTKPFPAPTGSTFPLNRVSQDQTLPTISLVLGIIGLLGFCCYLGLPLGLAAVITGYLGMKNVDKDPIKYGGKGLAIGGIIVGAISFLLNLLMIFIGIISNIGR